MSSLSLPAGVTAESFESRFWTTMIIIAFHFFYWLMPELIPGSTPGEEGRVDARA